MINGVGVKTHSFNTGDIMANRNVVGRVMIVLEIPDGGILRASPSGHPNIDIRKGSSEIINDIILRGISVTDWSSEGIKMPGGHETPVITLTYEGGV